MVQFEIYKTFLKFNIYFKETCNLSNENLIVLIKNFKSLLFIPELENNFFCLLTDEEWRIMKTQIFGEKYFILFFLCLCTDRKWSVTVQDILLNVHFSVQWSKRHHFPGVTESLCWNVLIHFKIALL